MKTKLLSVYMLVLIFGISCNKSTKNYSKKTGDLALSVPESVKELYLDQDDEIQSDKVVPQKIIKTSYLTFETQSVEKTYLFIKKWVKSKGGIIQNDDTQKTYNQINRSLVIRIPSDSFQSVIDSISEKVKVFDRKEITLQDVTEEFVDIEARLKAKKKLEERYLQLLSKAKSVKDMLEIERQIAQIREEIEAKQGRLKFLQNSVSLSTIHLDFYETVDVKNAPSKTYLSRLWQAVKGGFHAIGEFVLGVVYLWPFILLGTIVAIIIRKQIKKRKTKKINL